MWRFSVVALLSIKLFTVWAIAASGLLLNGCQTKLIQIITNKNEGLGMEKVIGTIVIEGVEFTVIEKGKTLYAGVYAVEPDMASKPNIDVYGTDNQILFEGCPLDETIKTIRNSVTPDWIITLNIDYTTDERPCAMLRGQETTSDEQPEGVHVIVAEPTLLIKVKYTHAAFELTKKLTGKYIHQYQLSELFGLIKHLFCEGEQAAYEFNGDNGSGNSDAEHHLMMEQAAGYLDGYVTVPVKRRSGNTGGEIKKNIDKNTDIAKPVVPRTEQDIHAMQVVPREFKKMTFGGRDWLVLDEQGDKALIMSETV